MRSVGYVVILGLITVSACDNRRDKYESISSASVPSNVSLVANGVTPGYTPDGKPIERIKTGNTTPAELLAFANSLTGIPYLYGSTDPKQGFDCSGFITHVFNHFNIVVPRRSVDFTEVEKEIDIRQAQTGDLILFAGTDSTSRVVGHMGILIAKQNEPLKFIHSTSGKAYGVTTTPLNPYYMGRYMKTVRIFKQNR
jgi:lipoprotein Spr